MLCLAAPGLALAVILVMGRRAGAALTDYSATRGITSRDPEAVLIGAPEHMARTRNVSSTSNTHNPPPPPHPSGR
ncbi:MAG: hypothetical protein WDW38_010090 [Sanguina aurantia]